MGRTFSITNSLSFLRTRKGSSNLLFILILFILGTAGIIILNKNRIANQVKTAKNGFPTPTFRSYLPTISPSPNPSPTIQLKTITPHADYKENTIPTQVQKWKTYRNTEYGFQIDYPNDWLALDKQDLAKIIGSSENYIVIFSEKEIETSHQAERMQISFREDTNETDTERWFDEEFKQDPSLPRSPSDPVKEKAFITSGGIKVVQQIPLFDQNYYFILKNKVIFIIARFTPNDKGLNSSKNTALKSVYEHMVGSLAF